MPEMPAKFEFLLYRRMFLNIERICCFVFLIIFFFKLGSGPFFRHGRGQSAVLFFYVALSPPHHALVYIWSPPSVGKPIPFAMIFA